MDIDKRDAIVILNHNQLCMAWLILALQKCGGSIEVPQDNEQVAEVIKQHGLNLVADPERRVFIASAVRLKGADAAEEKEEVQASDAQPPDGGDAAGDGVPSGAGGTVASDPG